MSEKVVAVVNSLCNAAQYRALIERVGLVPSATHESDYRRAAVQGCLACALCITQS